MYFLSQWINLKFVWYFILFCLGEKNIFEIGVAIPLKPRKA